MIAMSDRPCDSPAVVKRSMAIKGTKTHKLKSSAVDILSKIRNLRRKYFRGPGFRLDRGLSLLLPSRVADRRYRTNAGNRVSTCRRRAQPTTCRPPTQHTSKIAHTTHARVRPPRHCVEECLRERDCRRCGRRSCSAGHSIAACPYTNGKVRGTHRQARPCQSRLCAACNAQTTRSSAPAVDDETRAALPGPARLSQTMNQVTRGAHPTKPSIRSAPSLQSLQSSPARRRSRPRPLRVCLDTSRVGNSTTHCQKTRLRVRRHAFAHPRRARARLLRLQKTRHRSADLRAWAAA